MVVIRTLSGHRPRTAFDPIVWSGRALQEVFIDLAVSGLASRRARARQGVASARSEEARPLRRPALTAPARDAC